jgi:hypothetical protein
MHHDIDFESFIRVIPECSVATEAIWFDVIRMVGPEAAGFCSGNHNAESKEARRVVESSSCLDAKPGRMQRRDLENQHQ